MTQLNIIRDSHYVPMATLRRWSLDRTHVFAYQLLVPDDRGPEWQPSGIRSLACQRDLYTVFAGGKELDDFEKWLNVEFEHRGQEAIDRLVSGSRLTPEDWRSMILLVAVQDVRTPMSFVEWMNWCEQKIPKTLERVMRDSVKRLEKAKEQGIVLTEEPVRNEFSNLLKVTIEPSDDSSSDKQVLRSTIVAGRRLWIAIMRQILTGVAKRLYEHRWSIAEPYGDAEWPLTDHPVLRLNFYGPDRYNFAGGWGNPHTQIMMPVSPRHLLYVRVGQKVANRITLSHEQTKLVQRLIVERAHRWVFSPQPAEWEAKVRPRTVDPEIFAAEKKAWEDWHREQLQSEVSSAKRGGPETSK